MRKVYFVLQVLPTGQQEVNAIIEQRFEEAQLEEAVRSASSLAKILDTDKCVIEIVKWVNDVEDKVIFGV